MMLISKQGTPAAQYNFIKADSLPMAGDALAVECPADHIPDAVYAALDRIAMIRIPFASTSDGRGYSTASMLRERGYRGLLRARGQVISDQFRYAIECGFDEVEVDDDIAARQPREFWRYERTLSYRDKMFGGVFDNESS
jgi:uncharacterized protein (DUF934 family)